jgi:hypothetical protein
MKLPADMDELNRRYAAVDGGPDATRREVRELYALSALKRLTEDYRVQFQDLAGISKAELVLIDDLIDGLNVGMLQTVDVGRRTVDTSDLTAIGLLRFILSHLGPKALKIVLTRVLGITEDRLYQAQQKP